MTMGGAVATEFEQKLFKTGKKLLDHLPTSIEEILKLLDILESMLLQVEQEPTSTVENALLPSMSALIAPELFKHSNKDVSVSVAACLTEIMRIIAPREPYSVEILKEIFQLTVISFEWLSYVSSRGYTKAISILDSFSRVRACTLMLDLQCDTMIADMFRIFFNAVKYKHAPVVVLAMENVMITAIDESDETKISWRLLGQLLARVNKDQDTSSSTRKLAENVLTKCSGSKLKRFLLEAVQERGLILDDYAPIVAAICKAEIDLNEKAASDLPLVCPEEVLQAEDIVSKPETVDSTKGDKSSIQEETGCRKRDRKLNRLINSDEGYDPWSYTSSSRISTKRSVKSAAKLKKRKTDENVMEHIPSDCLEKKTLHVARKKNGNDRSSSAQTEKKSDIPSKVSAESSSVKVSGTLSDGLELVGKRLQVWWPLDETFYEGVVDSYDSVKRKHKVLYRDDGEEVLNLKKERWILINNDDSSNGLEEKTGEEKTEPQEKANSSETDESIDLNK